MTYILETKSDYEVRMGQILAFATMAGAQRQRAKEALKAIGAKPAFSLAFGPKIAVVSGDGSLSKFVLDLDANDPDYAAQAAQMSLDMEDSSKVSFVNPVLSANLVPGSTGLNKMIDDFPVYCGVCVIVAGSGAGKTPLAHALAGAGTEEYATVRIGEPFASYTSNNAMAAASMATAGVASADVVVDSIKDLLGAGGGGTAKGGVSRVALSMLSHWSALGAALGCTFYIPLNPSTGDDETTKLLVEAAKSSATTTVYLENGVWKYSARPGEGMERMNGTLSRDIMTRDTAARGHKSGRLRNGDSIRADGNLTTNISSDVLAGIIQRSTFSKV